MVLFSEEIKMKSVKQMVFFAVCVPRIRTENIIDDKTLIND